MERTEGSRWIWVAWETQRRSVELAKELNCELYIFDYSGMSRYPKCCLKTFSLCLKKRPNVLFVQNPSMILAVFASCLKFFFHFKLVVDRHSSFRVGKNYKIASDTNIFLKFIDKTLNRISVSCADLTIITNNFLARVVEELGGRPFILPDKIPQLNSTAKMRLDGASNILLVSSFDLDEPFEEIFKALALLENQNIHLYVTGNYFKLNSSVSRKKPANVIFTGFLSEKEFVNIIYAADAVMALTTSDHTMLCSCYEAVSACQPLITSKKDVLCDYFIGARFVENTSIDIKNGIEDVLQNKSKYIKNISTLKHNLTNSWKINFDQLVNRLQQL